MPVELHTPKTELSQDSEKRIQRHVAGLERRLVNFPTALISLTIRDRTTERRHTVDLRVNLGVDGDVLVSHQSGESAEHATRLAVEDAQRQLERYIATLRGKHAYGTPSRREPRDLRPASQIAELEEEEIEEDLAIEPDGSEP